MNRYIITILLSVAGIGTAMAQGPVDTLGTGANPPGVSLPPLPPVTGVSAYNNVTTYTPLVPMTDPNAVPLGSVTQVKRVRVYKSGFNEAMQSEARNVSSGKHLVSFKYTNPYRDEATFLSYTSGSTGFKSDPRTEQRAYYAGKYPEEGSTGQHAIGFRKVTSDATKRTIVTYAPGKNNVGGSRGVTVKMVTNAANEVRIWNQPTTAGPVSTGYYGANQLFGEEVTDMHGKKSVSYKDKDGNIVYKKQLEGSAQWIITQYVYDLKGKLLGIISPKASRTMGIGATTVPLDIWNNLCFQYQYDLKGRKSAERNPGEGGFTELVYDRKQRVVMRRSPLETGLSKWEVVFYDIKGRVKTTAMLNNNETRGAWQNRIDTTSATSGLPTTNLLYYICTSAGERIYPTATISGLTYMSYSYYDNYDVAPSVAMPYSTSLFSSETVPGAEPVPANRMAWPKGLPTLSKTRVLKDAADTDLSDWTELVVYYDQKGRVIQGRATNALKNGSNVQGLESTSTQYNFLNAPMINKHVHNNKKNNHNFTEETKYTYEAGTAKLLQTHHRMNETGSWKMLATYTYDDMGRLRRKELGDNGEVQDFSYNIRGQLTGINGAYASTGNKGGMSRSFGEQLFYDYGYTTPRYDGKIRGMVWRGSGGFKMHYGYQYDTLGRLLNADFGQYNTGTSTWTKASKDHTVSNIAYDANGNMIRMQQRGMGIVSGSLVPVTMDNLNYTYETNSNRLQSVSDVVTTDYANGDFQDGNTGSADYSYDAGGNLTKDLNKGITAVTYTHFNKPQVVTFSNGNIVRYVYDASGVKLKEAVTDSGYTYKRDYIGNAVYKNDTLLYLSTEEGRTTYDPADSKYKEEYFVKDHLGNVRSIVEVQATPFTAEYLATFELSSAFTEGILFDMVEEVRADRPAGTAGNEYSGMLSRDEYPVGTSVVLKVMAGDRIELSVDNMYESYDPQQDNPLDDSELLDQILNTLLTGPGGTPAEGGNAQLIEGLFNPQNFSTFIGLTNGSIDSTKPLAALNYILYDQQMQVVGSFVGRIQANGEGGWTSIGTGIPMEVPNNGYLAVFLTNKSGQPVYFDDLRIRFTKGLLKEENHYYPHGLPMARIGSTAAGATENRQKHQGNEYIKDAGLNWMDFGFRQYDPQIGRFLGVDPMGDYFGQDRYSPYVAMGNQPESAIDPNGLAPLSMNDEVGPLESSLEWATSGPQDASKWSPNPDKGYRDESSSQSHLMELNPGADGGGGGMGAVEETNQLLWLEYAIEYNNTTGNDLVLGGETSVNDPGQESQQGNEYGKSLSVDEGEWSANAVTYYEPDDNRDIGGDVAMDFTLVYKGDLSKYSKVDWIQNVTTDKEFEGIKQTVDYENWRKDGTTNPPFYYPTDKMQKTMRKQNNKNAGGEVFKDNPSLGIITEYSSTKATSFIGEVSLVGMRNGKWEHVATFVYGFASNRYGAFMYSPRQIPGPTNFQQGLIDQANR